MAHIMRHLIKTMSPTCRLKWKSIFPPQHIYLSLSCGPASLSFDSIELKCPVLVGFCLASYLKCLHLFLLSFILYPRAPFFPVFWLHKFIINCFKASRCLSAFCLEFIQRNRDTISSCGFPFAFPFCPISQMLFVCRLCYPYDDFLNRFSN